MKFLIFLMCTTCLASAGVAQSVNTDSLESIIRQDLPDTSRIQVMLQIAEALKYTNPDKMHDYSKRAAALSRRLGYSRGLVGAYYQLTTYFEVYRNDDSLKFYFDETIHLADSLKDKSTYANVKNARGLYLVSKRHYEEALMIFYEVQKIREEAGNQFGVMATYNNIGLVFMELRQYSKAIKQFQMALRQIPEPHPFVLNNIGSCFGSLHQLDSALYYTSLALDRAVATNNLQAEANALNIHGDALTEMGRYEEALACFLKAEPIRAKVNNPAMQVADLTNISSLYAKLNEPQKGIAYGQRALNMALQGKLDYKLENIYEALAENYESAGD